MAAGGAEARIRKPLNESVRVPNLPAGISGQAGYSRDWIPAVLDIEAVRILVLHVALSSGTVNILGSSGRAGDLP